MRALAAFDPSDWLSPEVARGSDELARLGYAYNTDSPTLQKWVDPIPDGKRPKDEDPRGILLRRHPLAMLRDTPKLWELAAELMDGVTNELTREDRYTRSNAEWELVLTWQAAAARRQEREIRQGVSDGN